jgi:hypothetical protein
MVEQVELEEYLTTLEFNRNSDFNDLPDEDEREKQPGRVFKIISKEDNLDENLPEEYKNLKAIYDKFSKI